jgi:hypothetical protein
MNDELLTAIQEGWVDANDLTKPMGEARIAFLLRTLILDYKGRIPRDLEKAIFEIVRASYLVLEGYQGLFKKKASIRN